MTKPELLIPAGNFEKMKVAIHYGADAVYLAGPDYGLRKKAGNFSIPEIELAVQYAHERGTKVYITVNIFPRNSDLEGISTYLKEIENIGADAVIISDPGIVQISKKNAPGVPVHLSTQANTTNWASAKFWADQGVSRICLARELSLSEIKEIKENTGMEIELFIHGAMCISYSGRCFMSKYMSDRDANEGECSQSCRWEYSLVENKRQGEHFPIEQDERGTYFFSSKDLCLIQYIPELVESGASSFKIEGRMKSVYYTGMITKIYREAIDKYCDDRENFRYCPEWEEELRKTSNRDFTTGFFNGKPDDGASMSSSNTQTHDFMGIVTETLSENRALVKIKNKFLAGEKVEWIGKRGKPVEMKVEGMVDTETKCRKDVAQPNDEVIIQFNAPVEKYDILRKEKNGRYPNKV